jgi:phosphoglycolate phosphatase
MSELKLVIFDLDGTLINAYPAIYRSFNYTMHQMERPLQRQDVIKAAVGWGDANLLKPFLKPACLDSALSIYRKHHRLALLKGAKLYPRVKYLLAYLKRKKIKLAVASNRPTVFSLILIKHLGLKKYFDYILCGDKVTYGKPNPEILFKIMDRLKVKPAESLFVGDMVIDAQAGRRAGVRTGIVTTGSSSISEIKRQKPLFLLRKIADLPTCGLFSPLTS